MEILILRYDIIITIMMIYILIEGLKPKSITYYLNLP